MNLIGKKKLLGLLYEYAQEKCIERHGDCGEDYSDYCPFNEGVDEGMHWCGLHALAYELGGETGQGAKIGDELIDLKINLIEEKLDSECKEEDD